MAQKNLTKIFIYITLFVFAVGIFAWWVNYNWTRGRDYRRLADLKILQSALVDYYGRFNTYKIPDCQAGSLVNLCLGKNSRAIGLDNIIDPISKSPFQYQVVELADDNFFVSFYFETSMLGLPAGKHTLTKNGISK
ncbi:MAG: hypothetical protein WC610_01965 [Patescibacteria group bacterium]